jgi:hypothetical protein
MKLAKRGDGMWIDMAVAAVLAHHARGHAIEDGALNVRPPVAPPVSIPSGDRVMTSRLATQGF